MKIYNVNNYRPININHCDNVLSIYFYKKKLFTEKNLTGQYICIHAYMFMYLPCEQRMALPYLNIEIYSFKVPNVL